MGISRMNTLWGLTLLAAIGSPAASGSFVMYDNTATQTGYSFNNAGATTAGLTTAMVADDITAGAGLGGYAVNSITFSVNNLNTSSATFNTDLVFYSANGASGGPGTEFAAVGVSAITMTASSANLFTITSTASGGFFTMPTGTFWAGIIFFNGTGDGITRAKLNNLGQLTYAPPDIGSSTDDIFQSSAAGTLNSNPAGVVGNFGGTPVADFGWSFSTNSNATTAVPEPSSLILCGIAGVIGLGIARFRRARAA